MHMLKILHGIKITKISSLSEKNEEVYQKMWKKLIAYPNKLEISCPVSASAVSIIFVVWSSFNNLRYPLILCASIDIELYLSSGVFLYL